MKHVWLTLTDDTTLTALVQEQVLCGGKKNKSDLQISLKRIFIIIFIYYKVQIHQFGLHRAVYWLPELCCA